LSATYWTYPYFFKMEYRHWLATTETARASELGGGRDDVTLKSADASGYAFQMGYIIMRPLGLRLTLEWAHWHFGGSTWASDGVETLSEPDQNITETTLGLGLIF
jgi:hypothetical protein